jgi:hypothetical protein
MADELNGDVDDATLELEDLQPFRFDIFVLSLNASALIHLGDSVDSSDGAASGPREVNLPLARQTIDILTMLEIKTRGNLSGEEERLLHQILFDLRLRYSRRAGR